MSKLKIDNSAVVTKKRSLSLHKLTKDGLHTYGTGKRKNAIARVWVKPGSGVVLVNGKNVNLYFPRETHSQSIIVPFAITNSKDQYDVICTVKGGGLSGQAGAIKHGVAKALDKLVPDFHKALRQGGFLTRDSRIVERKKYGKHKARKSTQFSKR
ncbi:MAG: 30S ribosomal protein S9 [Rickettsiaceae bacterium]|nr:MAG: 30S ribosomal protein S9 [Rickettsiaceae bacterium]